MKDQGKAILLGAVVVFFWATVATAFKTALSGMSEIMLLLIASIVTLILSFSELLLSGKIRDLTNCFKDRKIIRRNALMGMFNPFLYYLLLFKAYSLLPAQIAQPLNYAWQVVLIIMIAVVFKEKLTIRKITGVIVSFAGVVILSTNRSAAAGSDLSIEGIGLVLITTFLWAFYWILNMKSDENPVIGLFKNFVFGTIYLLVFILFFPDTLSFRGESVFKGDFPDMIPFLAAVYTGFFEMGITFMIWGKALKLATNRMILTQMIYLSPVLSLFLIHFVLGENIGYGTVAGLLFIIGGLAISNIKQEKHIV